MASPIICTLQSGWECGRLDALPRAACPSGSIIATLQPPGWDSGLSSSTISIYTIWSNLARIPLRSAFSFPFSLVFSSFLSSVLASLLLGLGFVAGFVIPLSIPIPPYESTVNRTLIHNSQQQLCTPHFSWCRCSAPPSGLPRPIPKSAQTQQSPTTSASSPSTSTCSPAKSKRAGHCQPPRPATSPKLLFQQVRNPTPLHPSENTVTNPPPSQLPLACPHPPQA